MDAQDEHRKASTASAPNYALASEDDAAVLGKPILDDDSISDMEHSQAWVQAGVAP